MPLFLPEGCPRGRTDCEALARIDDDEGGGFTCCGRNDGSNRCEPLDEFRVCFRNDVIDEMTDYDRRDLIDTASVLIQALSADENMRGGA